MFENHWSGGNETRGVWRAQDCPSSLLWNSDSLKLSSLSFPLLTISPTHILFKNYLFILLIQVLGGACGIFSLPFGM